MKNSPDFWMPKTKRNVDNRLSFEDIQRTEGVYAPIINGEERPCRLVVIVGPKANTVLYVSKENISIAYPFIWCNQVFRRTKELPIFTFVNPY